MMSSLLQERLFWRQEFLGFTGETQLPLDYRRPLAWSGKYRELKAPIPADLELRLAEITQNSPLSMLILLSAAWALLLGRYTGESDVVFAIPAYAKSLTLSTDNILCVRIKLPKASVFKQFLLQVKAKLISILHHQRLNYEEVLTEIGLSKRRNRSIPFCSVLFHPEIQDKPKINHVRSDLFLSLQSTGGSLGISIDYNSDLFYSQSIHYLALHLREILQSICQNTYVPIEQISCFSAFESEQLRKSLTTLVEGSDKEDYPCIHQVFETVAAQYPQKIALEADDICLTYEQLNEKANQIAHYLLNECQVQPGEFVGFVGDRSIAYCIAILGILKAGCAFVPVDKSYPIARIRSMIEISQTRIVINDASPLQFDSNVRVLNLREETSVWASHFKLNPACAVSSRSPAYLIYTSGSTGRQKGVVIRHNGKMNHLIASQRSLNLNESTSCLFSASISTDISIWQALVGLLSGGKTVIIHRETLFDCEQFWGYLETKRVTVMQFVPTFLNNALSHLAQCLLNPQLPDAKYLILSGEEIQPSLINRWFSRFSHIPVINAYGPSEASDIVSQQGFEGPINPLLNHVSIGKPISNVQLFILDRERRVQPFYVPGEIYVAGVAVGNGYLHDKEKTRASFVPNPLDPHGCDTWYKTGDFGRMCHDSSVEYLGRVDTQVKIRGYRVELTEIEACLLMHPLVNQCKVLIKTIQNQEDTLCAWIVPPVLDSPQDVVRKQVRAHLAEYLPEFMIPNPLYLMDRFPLLPGGKIDVLSLLNLESPLNTPIKSPTDDLEHKLIQVLADVVGIARGSIGMESNFFDLGGTSIHLMALKYQIKERFSTDIPIAQLFRCNTAQDLADNIRAALQAF